MSCEREKQLNEIAVSDRGTLRGLTQFCGRLSLSALLNH